MLYTHVVYYFITLAYCTASAPNMVSENKYKRNEQGEKLNTEKVNHQWNCLLTPSYVKQVSQLTYHAPKIQT